MDILDRFLKAVEKKLGPDVFTAAIAADLEQQFRFDYGADSYYVASLRAFEAERRAAEARKLIEAGLTDTEIAERLGMSRQHAHRIRHRLA